MWAIVAGPGFGPGENGQGSGRQAPARSEGNYRLYGPEHLERLVFIRNCRTLDMTC
ncbi:MerR family transcriptional regulator, partial [uncultured Pseudomonas sp.]|uniref:MerR family transcriptional regulator n=1 Tax=uncultured Pseudomonas sp. TaxID=114707 RepID=UPI00338EDD0A